MIYCPSCGKEMHESARACPSCGAPNQNAPVEEGKSRIVAGVLALLLGGFGVHRFYLGQIGRGMLYLLFFWTCVPGIIALVEGIVYLCGSEAAFNAKFNRRY